MSSIQFCNILCSCPWFVYPRFNMLKSSVNSFILSSPFSKISVKCSVITW